LNKKEKVKNIMRSCQGVNLLLCMMKVWTDLNTALFSSSFRFTEPKISSLMHLSCSKLYIVNVCNLILNT